MQQLLCFFCMKNKKTSLNDVRDVLKLLVLLFQIFKKDNQNPLTATIDKLVTTPFLLSVILIIIYLVLAVYVINDW